MTYPNFGLYPDLLPSVVFRTIQVTLEQEAAASNLKRYPRTEELFEKYYSNIRELIVHSYGMKTYTDGIPEQFSVYKDISKKSFENIKRIVLKERKKSLFYRMFGIFK